ncbi:MAG TPA: M48 family metalloprotease [Solirubrobacterales bacterium]|nr:M48 family metalloprotease [Solirubrobacterales bacterium]
MRPLRPATLAVLAGLVLWAVAAHLLWTSTELPSLDLPQLDPDRYFTDSFLERSASYERFLAIVGVLASLVLVAVLAAYARRGQELARESAAGRVGTGMLLAMLGFALVWLAQAPFGVLSLWWERRYDVADESYPSYLLESFLGLGSQFIFLCAGIGIMMGLAGVMRRWWWLAAAPAFLALALLFAFLTPYLIPDNSPVRSPALQAEARALERIQGTDEARLRVQDADRFTDAPNALAAGFGPTSTVILWDTLLDDDFSRSEVRFVLAHEIAHLAHEDTLKRVGWLALFLVPALALTALLTRRRGGLAQPEAIPVAILVLVVLQLAATPLLNASSRRQEAAADWAALEATRNPTAARGLIRQLATKSLSDPDPPLWVEGIYGSHPTMIDRIAMAYAWEEGQR